MAHGSCAMELMEVVWRKQQQKQNNNDYIFYYLHIKQWHIKNKLIFYNFILDLKNVMCILW